MFGNLAWSEILIIAGIALVVIGPKELPGVLRVLGRYFGKIKGVADDFRTQLDDVVRETQVNDIKDNILKEVEGVKAALPSEKDIGLDFSELDSASDKPSKPHIDDEDENLDWDEPDEVIETSADGEVTKHSKKEESEEEPTQQAVDEDVSVQTEEISDETVNTVETSDAQKVETASESQSNTEMSPSDQKKTKSAVNGKEASQKNGKASKPQNVSASDDDDYDFDEDDGALLDEESGNENDNRTSMDVLAEGREKFKETLEAELKEAKTLKKEVLDNSSDKVKSSKSAKHEAQSSAVNG